MVVGLGYRDYASQLCGDYFINYVIKPPGSNGKYPRFFFVAHLVLALGFGLTNKQPWGAAL